MAVLECEQIDTIFALSEQKVTEGLLSKKQVPANAYYGKVNEGGTWPMHSGTSWKGHKLGRIGIPDCTGWRKIEDGLCATNLCSFEPDVIQHGHEDYYFSAVMKDLRTDWICIDSLAFREMPEQEIMKLEEGLRASARYVHEEFRRSRYLAYTKNKLIGVLPDDGGDPNLDSRVCQDALTQNGYVFELRDNGELDECHVRARIDPDNLDYISEFSLDMADYAVERLQYEDERYLGDTGLFDLLLADRNMSNRLAIQESQDMQNSPVYGGSGYNLVDLRRTYGTQRVLRDYSMRADIHAMRFYPDTVANAALEAYDADNPTTWPRFFRVFPYVPVQASVAGIKFVTNEAYLKAPFGISTILNRRVMTVMSSPNVVSVGGAAKVGGFGYDGTAQWQNPDWPCNVNRDKGFWKLRFRLAARPDYDEEGYSYFHRIDRGTRLVGTDCPIPTTPCSSEVSAYCYAGMGGDPVFGENRAIDERI